MRKFLTGAVAALTFIGVAAAAQDASAQRRGRDRDDAGAAVAAGVLGFALGATVGGNGRTYYSQPYYGYSRPYYGGYYGRGYYRRPVYGYYPPPRTCTVWRWDPYYRRNMPVNVWC